MSQIKTGAEDVRFDLSGFYTGIDDPQIDIDIAAFCARAKDFHEIHKGNLAETLGQAIIDQIALAELEKKIGVFLQLRGYLDTGDGPAKAKLAQATRMLTSAQADYLEFFELEVIGLEEDVIEKHAKENPEVARQYRWLEFKRTFRPHKLSEAVESAVTRRSPFGPSAWSTFFNAYSARLRFPWMGELKNLPQILHIGSNEKDPEMRARALQVINDGLAGDFAEYSAEALYQVAAGHAVEVRDRGYGHPMAKRNKENRLSDATVEALHASVIAKAAPLARRYYKFKANILGIPTLRWSDRNAPMPFASTAIIPWDQGLDMVLRAYRSFSPTLAGMIEEMISKGRIDASSVKGKRYGAFNYPGVFPGGESFAYTFLNYLGGTGDVMTLAHELGHGVHFMLAGKKKGVLQQVAPMVLCETASVFGEMTTFMYLKDELVRRNDKHSLLVLLMAKIDEMINVVNRQIGFSNFERRLHGWNPLINEWQSVTRYSVEDLNTMWLETLYELYGRPGEMFTYENAAHLWSYVPHLLMVFYVYAYAFGELLTHSLYARSKAFGDKFEPLYLKMLEEGGSKSAVELLRPFGLDPSDPEFWNVGIEVSLGKLIPEAEALAHELKLIS